jgi:hypothetical protein
MRRWGDRPDGMDWLEPDKRLRLYRYMLSIFKEKNDFTHKDILPPIDRLSRDSQHRVWNGYTWEIQ